jgi:hypothetical protein
MKLNIGGEQDLATFLYVTPDFTQLGGTETKIGRKGNGLEPEFCLEVIASDMNVRRLIVLPAVEMKPVGAYPEHGGHGGARIDMKRHDGRQPWRYTQKKGGP